MSATSLNLNAISHPIVKLAIEAMNSWSNKQWYALFSDSPTFTDDGNPHDFTKWCERELFGSSRAYLASIDKIENGGLTIYSRFHLDQWEISRPFSNSM
jgi:hypothetical protein